MVMIMSDAVITPRLLRGTVAPPPSKSALHRAIICSALAHGESVVAPYTPSEDIDATIGAARSLGACIRPEGSRLLIDGGEMFSVKNAVVDCRESGSTLRFFIPVAAAGGVCAAFTGRGRLPERPLTPYLALLPRHGVGCGAGEGLPLQISGRLRAGRYELAGNISSQFVTGLLLALPLLEGESEIVLTTPPESSGYIALTLDIERQYGITLEETNCGYRVSGGQTYRSRSYTAEGDWSQAAFWLAAGAIGAQMSCPGLKADSTQGDRAIAGLLARLGAMVSSEGGAVVARAADLHGIEIDAAQIPDLVPALAAVAVFARGTTRIFNAARLRLKESDRLHALVAGFGAIGAHIREEPDGLEIEGVEALRGGEAEGFGDHRIVMALAVAAQRSTAPVKITGCDCIKKSYPAFFADYNRSGGNVHVINVG
ncbi:MAG: 3-phosphoshikimate 1-carboxyvinyltransferase [Clostridia bacterium]|nr:3-phosphoshikimate 1-carboxyvinyltransferase [Clostridia bacterium]